MTNTKSTSPNASRFSFVAALALSATLIAGLPGCAAGAGRPAGNEWHHWRGPDENGFSRATAVGVPSFAEEDILWKADAGGRSTPIIMDGRVYVIRLTGDGPTWQEEVVSVDADTGAIVWRHPFPIFHTDIPSDRVGWSSVEGDPETGYVYAHGVQGVFLCLDRDGNVVWERSLTEEFGRISGYGGRTHTPLVDGNLVIVSFLNSGLGPQGPGRHRYLAMDKRTGEVVYWATPGGPPLDTTFSVPVVAVINGRRQLVAGNADGWIYGMDVATGEKIWGFQLAKRGINSSVVVSGDRVYAQHGEDNIDDTTMGRVVCIDATGEGDVTKTHEVWRANGVRASYSSPVLAESRLYVVDNAANLIVLDADTGEEHWRIKIGKIGWGSPVWADGRIYVADADGGFHVIEAGDEAGAIISSTHFSEEGRGVIDIRGCPAIAYGRVYLMARNGLYCTDSQGKYTADALKVEPLASIGKSDGLVTHVQVVPGEVHLNPGETVVFTANGFDSMGRPTNNPLVLPEWSLKGLKGELNGNTFTAAADVNGQFGSVSVRNGGSLGGQIGTSRVRVKTTIPLYQDFNSIEPGKTAPNNWIGNSRVKFKVIEEDGERFLRKDADNIRFRRGFVYIGPPESSHYTLQVDVRAHEKRRSLPDMGLIHSRYVFDLRGNDQEVRIYAWVPMPRVIEIKPFDVEPGVWYRLKCEIEYHENGATVRGKVWNRDEKEPEDWTIELEDPNPNMNGSPGLACFSMAEVDYDNIAITPMK